MYFSPPRPAPPPPTVAAIIFYPIPILRTNIVPSTCGLLSTKSIEPYRSRKAHPPRRNTRNGSSQEGFCCQRQKKRPWWWPWRWRLETAPPSGRRPRPAASTTSFQGSMLGSGPLRPQTMLREETHEAGNDARSSHGPKTPWSHHHPQRPTSRLPR